MLLTARLVKKYREETDKKEWALLESDGPRVLKWFGSKKPTEEEVLKEERRVQFFKHRKASLLEVREGLSSLLSYCAGESYPSRSFLANQLRALSKMVSGR